MTIDMLFLCTFTLYYFSQISHHLMYWVVRTIHLTSATNAYFEPFRSKKIYSYADGLQIITISKYIE